MSPNFPNPSKLRAPIAITVSSAQTSSFEPLSCHTLYERVVQQPFFSHSRCSFSRCHSKPWTTLLLSSHSVPSMQFQVLLTCSSAFFSTFLRSTFPLSVFMSYLDLGEIYLLLSAEITINRTLREVEIWHFPGSIRGFHPLWRRFPTYFQSSSAQPCHFPKRSIGLTVVVPLNPFPLICTFFVRHY